MSENKYKDFQQDKIYTDLKSKRFTAYLSGSIWLDAVIYLNGSKVARIDVYDHNTTDKFAPWYLNEPNKIVLSCVKKIAKEYPEWTEILQNKGLDI